MKYWIGLALRYLLFETKNKALLSLNQNCIHCYICDP